MYNKQRVLLLFLFFLSLISTSELLPFGQKTFDMIFQDLNQALILFDDNSNKTIQQVVSIAARRDSSKRVYTFLDKSLDQDQFKHFMNYMGIKLEKFPSILYVKKLDQKYIFNDQITADGLSHFINQANKRKIKPALKSLPIPEKNDKSFVLTLVGLNYLQVIYQDQRQYLVKIFAPWCNQSKKIAADFQEVAKILSKNPNIILAQFDATANQVEGMRISSYPSLIWYSKDKSQDVIQYRGARKKAQILEWIKRNSKHQWIQERQQKAGIQL